MRRAAVGDTMNKSTALVGLAVSALIVSCTTSLEPDGPRLTKASSDFVNSAEESPRATGSGDTIVAGTLRTFSFAVWQNVNATAQGTAVVDNRFVNEMFKV